MFEAKRIGIILMGIMSMTVLLLPVACNERSAEVVEVDFSSPGGLPDDSGSDDTLAVLRVAIAPVISPRESFSYYHELFDYMGSRLNMKIEFRQRPSYEEVNEMLERNQIDLAFICTGAYIEGSAGMDLLVGPLFKGNPFYQAYVITSLQSEITQFEEFQGKRFVYTDPMSFTGKLYPEKRIRDLGADPNRFFASVQYTHGHDVSIQMVSRNLVEGASVSGLIYHYLQATNPAMIQNVRIIERSDRFGVPPIVTSLMLSPETFRRIQDLFLEMHLDPVGREILDKLIIDRFSMVSDTLYNSAREIREIAWH
ncbi:MAG: PhnD/SsuA/transferrin family substrate-binding protein [Bacteroidales bacterium]